MNNSERIQMRKRFYLFKMESGAMFMDFSHLNKAYREFQETYTISDDDFDAILHMKGSSKYDDFHNIPLIVGVTSG